MGVQHFPDARIQSASQVLPPTLKPCQLTVSVYPADFSVDLGLSWAGSHLLLPPMDFVSPLKSGVFGAPRRVLQRVPSMPRDGRCTCLSVLKPCDSCSSGHDPLSVSPPHTSVSSSLFQFILSSHLQFLLPTLPAFWLLTQLSSLCTHLFVPYYTAEMVGDGDHDSDPSFHSPTTTSYCYMPTQHQAKSYFVF